MQFGLPLWRFPNCWPPSFCLTSRKKSRNKHNFLDITASTPSSSRILKVIIKKVEVFFTQNCTICETDHLAYALSTKIKSNFPPTNGIINSKRPQLLENEFTDEWIVQFFKRISCMRTRSTVRFLNVTIYCRCLFSLKCDIFLKLPTKQTFILRQTSSL